MHECMDDYQLMDISGVAEPCGLSEKLFSITQSIELLCYSACL